MRVTIDRAADAAYIYLVDRPPGRETKEFMDRGVYVDFRDGVLIGIELLTLKMLPPELLAIAEDITRKETL